MEIVDITDKVEGAAVTAVDLTAPGAGGMTLKDFLDAASEMQL